MFSVLLADENSYSVQVQILCCVDIVEWQMLLLADDINCERSCNAHKVVRLHTSALLCCIFIMFWTQAASSLPYCYTAEASTLCPPPPKKKQGTHIMANNFHKHQPISMPFDRIVLATLLDNLP